MGECADGKEKIFEISSFQAELADLCKKHDIHGGYFTWIEASMHNEKMKVPQGAMMCVGGFSLGCMPCSMLSLASSLIKMDSSCTRALTGAMQLLRMQGVEHFDIKPNSSETVN